MLMFFFAVSGACAGNRVPHVAPDESRPHITWRFAAARVARATLRVRFDRTVAAVRSRGQCQPAGHRGHGSSVPSRSREPDQLSRSDGDAVRRWRQGPGDQHDRSARESASLFAAQWKSGRGPRHLPAQHCARRHSNRRRRSDQDHAASPRGRQGAPGGSIIVAGGASATCNVLQVLGATCPACYVLSAMCSCHVLVQRGARRTSHVAHVARST